MEESTGTLTPRSAPGLQEILEQHSRSTSRRRAETEDSEKAGRVWAREVEPDKAWWPCILTLDGGGIRGYSSLLILKALMHEVWLLEQYFDEEEHGPMVASPTSAGTESPRGRYGYETPNAQAGASDSARPSSVPAQTSPLANEVVPSQEAPTDVLLQDDLTTSQTARKAISEEELLPCHYFDFLYGTSTGGLIATMLGRLRMTTSECLELYRKVGDDLFGKKRSSIPLTTKYYHEPLEKAVRDLVGARCHEHPNCDGHDYHPFEFTNLDLTMGHNPFDVEKPRMTQSCCLTATHDESISEAYLLRTYPHFYSDTAPNYITRYNEGADALKIWQVTRATSAAPFYFKMLEAETSRGEFKAFKDGGIRENNPSGAALSEFQSLFDGKADNPALLLSIGTGRPDLKQDGFADTWAGPFGRIPWVRQYLEKRAVVQNLLIKYTEGERQHNNMRTFAKGENTWYKRLNVSEGLESMALDDWIRGIWRDPATGEERVVNGGASLSHMERATEGYLARGFDEKVDSYAPPKVMLRQAAEKLVRQRRARERLGGERWRVFVGMGLPKRRDANAENGAAG